MSPTKKTVQGKGRGHGKGGRRKVDPVRHPDTGEIVERMHLHRATGTYFRMEKGEDEHGQKTYKPIYYPKRGLKGVAYLRRAIREHELGLQGRKPGTLETHIPFAVPPERVLRKIKDVEFVMPKDGKPGDMVYDLDDEYCVLLRKDAIYDWVREQIENPETRFDFAQRTVPEIAYLDRLRPPAESLALAEVADLYFNRRRKKIDKKTKDANQKFWKEFCTLVEVERLSEILPEHIRQYHDSVYNEYDQHGYSASYVGNRFDAVKTIFNNAAKNGHDLNEVHRVITLLKMLESPKEKKKKPRPIKPEHFKKILAAARNAREKAILLWMLNTAMKPANTIAVKKSDVDLSKGCYVGYRHKTDIPRAAVLWKRTIKALKQYQADYPHEAEALFANNAGEPFGEKAQYIQKMFRRLRKEAKVPASVHAEDIRKGAYTYGAANESDEKFDKVRVLAGHKVPISEDYILTHPEIVAGCCRKVEAVYFGRGKK